MKRARMCLDFVQRRLQSAKAIGRAGSVASLAGGLLLLAACGATKSHYPGAEANQGARSAEAASGTAAQTEGDQAATHQRLIAQMQKEGLWYASLAHIDQLEQGKGRTPATQRLRADALRHTGQTEASRAAYAQLEGTPEAAAGLHGLGLLAGAQGGFAQAAVLLAQAHQRQPTDALLLNDLGYARLRAGQLAEARVPLMQAAQLQPDNPRIQLNLAAWLLASGQPAQAERILAADRLGEASRQAVQETARLAVLAAQSVPAAGGAAPAAPAASAVAPSGVSGAVAAAAAPPAAPESLGLRRSNWQETRRIQVGVRRADGATEPAALAASTSTLIPQSVAEAAAVTNNVAGQP